MFQQRPSLLYLSLVTAAIIGVVLFLFTSCSAAEESASVKLIRRTTQNYLDQFFERSIGPKGSTPQTSVTSRLLPADELRECTIVCLNLARQHMQRFREVYVEESVKASKRLNVREDDSLRLFFVGDLLACLENLDSATAATYMKLTPGERRSLLNPSEVDKVFTRTVSTPVEFSEAQSGVLSSIADKYLETRGQSDGNSWIAAVFSKLPISILDGAQGFRYCSALLIILLFGTIAFGNVLPQNKKLVAANDKLAVAAMPSGPSDSKHVKFRSHDQHKKKK